MSRLPVLFAAGLLLACTAQTVADDLDRILARDKIAAGKLLSDAGAALRESVSLEKTSPASAALLLERSIADVKDSTVLRPEDRSIYLGRLQARLNAVNETLRIARIAVAQKATREAENATRKIRESAPVKGVGPSGVAKSYIGNVADQVAAADRLRKDRAIASNSIFRGIEVSATPINGVVEYPKYWARLLDSPHRGTGQKLNPKEVALLKTLNSTMSVDFENRKFSEVIDYIQSKTGLTIFVDKSSLEDAGVEYDDPVTFKVPRVTVRTVLKKVLADRNLTYVIKEGALQVVTPMKARDMMVVRTYAVSDLLGGADPRFGPFVNRAVMVNNAQGLIRTLQTAIDPGIWDINGGTATMFFNEATLTLVVRAPAELHYMMGSGGLFR